MVCSLKILKIRAIQILDCVNIELEVPDKILKSQTLHP